MRFFLKNFTTTVPSSSKAGAGGSLLPQASAGEERVRTLWVLPWQCLRVQSWDLWVPPVESALWQVVESCGGSWNWCPKGFLLSQRV